MHGGCISRERELGEQKPEAGASLECSGNAREASKAGAERARGYETAEEVWARSWKAS